MPLELKEITLEGVGPFRSARKITLGPGAVVFSAPNESGKSILLDLLAHLLDPTSDFVSLRSLRSKPQAERSRAALTLRATGGPMCLGVDLDACVFHLVPGSEPDALWNCEPVDPERVREQLGLPPVGLYRLLFTASRAGVSSRIDVECQRIRARTLQAERAEISLWEAQRELERVRSEIPETSPDLGEPGTPQSAYDEKLITLEKLELRLRDARKAARELAELRGQVKAFACLDQRLTPALEAKARGYVERKRAYAERERALRKKTGDLATRRDASIYSSSAALAGLGFVLAIGLSLYLAYPTLAARAVRFPAFEVIAGALLGLFLLIFQGWKLWLVLRTRQLANTVQREMDAFQEETAGVLELVEALQLDRPEDLAELVASRRSLRRRMGDFESQLARVGQPEELETQITILCERLAEENESGEPAPESASASVRERLGGAEREFREASKVVSESGEESAESGAALIGEEIEHLLDAAGRSSDRELAVAWADAKELVGLYLQALCDRRYTALRRRAAGAYLLEREGATTQSLDTVNETVLQLVRHAVQFALVERSALHLGLPLLLDDPFVGLDPARTEGAARAIRRLGAVGQVVLGTANPFFEEAADLVIKF